MKTALRVSFPAEVQEGLRQAVVQLRAKVDNAWGDSPEHEKMADLHYLAHELVDQQMSELGATEPEMERGALLDLREQVGRYVHRLIEATRHG